MGYAGAYAVPANAMSLRSWHKLEREAYRHEMSTAEKRRKDRDQGKLYKRIMAQKWDRR